MKLTGSELARFHERGYVVTPGFLGEDEIAHLRYCYTATVERLSSEHTLENVQSGGDRDEDFQVYQIRTAHLQHPVFRMLIHDTRLLDLVEGLIGPDIRLVHYQGSYKPPHTGGVIGWHQDNRYFCGRGRQRLSVLAGVDGC